MGIFFWVKGALPQLLIKKFLTQPCLLWWELPLLYWINCTDHSLTHYNTTAFTEVCSIYQQVCAYNTTLLGILCTTFPKKSIQCTLVPKRRDCVFTLSMCATLPSTHTIWVIFLKPSWPIYQRFMRPRMIFLVHDEWVQTVFVKVFFVAKGISLQYLKTEASRYTEVRRNRQRLRPAKKSWSPLARERSGLYKLPTCTPVCEAVSVC